MSSSFGQESFEESTLFSDNGPMTLVQRLGYVRQLIMSRTRLEFRLLWNKIFQKDDEELGWLLNPYRQQDRGEATMMASFNKNNDDLSYQYNYDDVSSALGRERVTIYNRGVARKGDSRRKRKDTKTFTENALQIARYMGMGVYITSTSFPSPFLPTSDTSIYSDLYTQPQYSMSRVW